MQFSTWAFLTGSEGKETEKERIPFNDLTSSEAFLCTSLDILSEYLTYLPACLPTKKFALRINQQHLHPASSEYTIIMHLYPLPTKV